MEAPFPPQPSAMDNKKLVTPRPPLPAAARAAPDTPAKEYGGKKAQPQHVRKREFDRPDPGKKPVGGRGGRTGQRYVRPREKVGGQIESSSSSEFGSIYRSGGKKQNITHLMDWWGPGHRSQRGRGHQGSGTRVRRHSSHMPRYKKEHYLQATCQFVVAAGEDYSAYSGDPDLLVEWRLVEEVRLHVAEAPACPICLYPPTAAKVTRCGHVFCFSCILHYLALSDESWRKCPICYEPVVKEELKSAVSVTHKEYGIGEEIEFQLMRRKHDSLLTVPVASYSEEEVLEIPHISRVTSATPYAKLLLATKEEVRNLIVKREQRDLLSQLASEGDQPEACFIEEALKLLSSRFTSLQSASSLEEQEETIEEGLDSLSLTSPDEPSSSDSLISLESLSPLSPEDKDLGFKYPDKAPVRDAKPPVDFTKASSFQHIDKSEETVTAEDLDISQLQPKTRNNKGQVQRNAPKSTFYFYQASSGAHIYLHAINVHMLVQEYGDIASCPHLFKATVVEKKSTCMTEELRRRLSDLKHLPLACSIDVVEVILKEPLVSKPILAAFQERIEARQRHRNKLARQERKIEKRVKAEQDRMFGRSKGATNLFIESHRQFPSFVEDIHIESLQQFPSFAEDVQTPRMSGGSDSGYQDGPGGSSECSASSTADSLYGSSGENGSTGMSFAKMIREGQTRIRHSNSEPQALTGVAWPTLGVTGSRPADSTSGGSAKPSPTAKAWGMKQSASYSGVPTQQHCDAGGSEDEEDFGAAPEFREAFSNAVSKALDAAVAKKATANADHEGTNSGKRGKKKQKQKKVVLFSSGGFG